MADTGKSRIVVFSQKGRSFSPLERKVWGMMSFIILEEVAVDGDGHIWVVDTQHHCIKVFDEKG